MNEEKCLALLRDVYKENHFISYLRITIDSVKYGEATLSMTVDEEKHTSQYGVAHGGALEALADVALGVACATMGKKVMTLSFNMSFIRNIHAGERATATARVRHNGRRTMVVDVDTVTESGALMNRTAATMFVRDVYDDIPTKW